MTSVLVIAALLAAAAGEAPRVASQPPLASVLSEAKAQHQAVFLDVYTAWCQPCAVMAKEVFPTPTVQKALQGYRFVAYDAEKGAGIDVAERFHINSYPTLLVLSSEGELIESVQSQDAAGIATALDRLRALASSSTPLLALAAQRPADARVQLLAAVQAESGTPEEVAQVPALLHRAVSADPINAQAVAAEAALHLAKLEAQARDAKTHASLLLAFAKRFPASPQALKALGAIAAFPANTRPPAAALRAALRRSSSALEKAHDPDALNQLLYAALALGENAEAVRAGQALARLTPKEGGNLDSLAEAYFQAGDAKKAVEVETRAIALGSNPLLTQNLARFQTGKPSAPNAPAPRDPLFTEPAKSHFEVQWAAWERTLHTFETRLTDHVHQACPLLPPLEYVRLTIAKKKIQRAVLLDPELSPELRHCAENAALTADHLPSRWSDLTTLARLEVHLAH